MKHHPAANRTVLGTGCDTQLAGVAEQQSEEAHSLSKPRPAPQCWWAARTGNAFLKVCYDW